MTQDDPTNIRRISLALRDEFGYIDIDRYDIDQWDDVVKAVLRLASEARNV